MQSNAMSKVMRSMMVAGLGLLLSVAAAGVAQAKEFVLGFQCDRSGPTQTVGAFLCDGVHDYFRLVNKQEKFGAGNSVRVFEIDIAYNTPRGVEAYERHKAAGALTYMIWGTPITYALTPKLPPPPASPVRPRPPETPPPRPSTVPSTPPPGRRGPFPVPAPSHPPPRSAPGWSRRQLPPPVAGRPPGSSQRP